LYTKAYPVLYLSYKLLLTFSESQVGCEHSFSKLKYIRNYLRNSITQDHLKSFILISVEKEILTYICSVTIVDKVALNSESLKIKITVLTSTTKNLKNNYVLYCYIIICCEQSERLIF
jgi:hypothetical protein